VSYVKVCLGHFTSFIQNKVEGFKYMSIDGNIIVIEMPYWHIRLKYPHRPISSMSLKMNIANWLDRI
jgi:hypothetical protein